MSDVRETGSGSEPKPEDKPGEKPDEKAADTTATVATEDDGNSEETADKPAADPKHPVMAVKVYAPFKIYFEGEAVSVTAANETGPFDILPHHRNFLCMLVPCDLIIKTPYDTKTIRIARALLHVKKDAVAVFVDV